MTQEAYTLEKTYNELLQNNIKPVAVILTGAGISAESGIPTFRDANGLWEGHDVHEVASPQGWSKNPELVLRFYNLRRKAAWNAIPNAAHLALVELEKHCLVIIITQNVDSLHEKAGSSHVIHLHGELRKVRSTGNPNLVYDYEDRPISIGDCCAEGYQLRPHIVWFGEEVPLIHLAVHLSQKADFFLVIGTSLQVYPAASLIDCSPKQAFKYVIDRRLPPLERSYHNLNLIEECSTTGVPKAVDQIIQLLNNRAQG